MDKLKLIKDKLKNHTKFFLPEDPLSNESACPFCSSTQKGFINHKWEVETLGYIIHEKNCLYNDIMNLNAGGEDDI